MNKTSYDRPYLTSFCNKSHNLLTGRPLGHECYVLPPAAIQAEFEGNVDEAVEILAVSKMRIEDARRSDEKTRLGQVLPRHRQNRRQ